MFRDHKLLYPCPLNMHSNFQKVSIIVFSDSYIISFINSCQLSRTHKNSNVTYSMLIIFLMMVWGWLYLAATESGSSRGSNYLLIRNSFLSVNLVILKIKLYCIMLVFLFYVLPYFINSKKHFSHFTISQTGLQVTIDAFKNDNWQCFTCLII